MPGFTFEMTLSGFIRHSAWYFCSIFTGRIRCHLQAAIAAVRAQARNGRSAAAGFWQ